MKIYRSITWDIETGAVLAEDSYEYCGSLALAKGEQKETSKFAKEQAKEQLALQKAQMAQQRRFTDPVYGGLSQYLKGDVGYNPEQMAMLISQFLDTNAQNFREAGSNVSTALRRRGSGGGDLPVGGDYTKMLATLEGLKGATDAAGVRDVRLANLQQALQNKFNAAGIFSGTGANYGNQGVGLGGVGVGFTNASIAAGQGRPGFWENLGNSFAKTLGEIGGKVVTGGLGKMGVPGMNNNNQQATGG